MRPRRGLGGGGGGEVEPEPGAAERLAGVAPMRRGGGVEAPERVLGAPEQGAGERGRAEAEAEETGEAAGPAPSLAPEMLEASVAALRCSRTEMKPSSSIPQ